jgi:hypothetical protein
MKKENPRLCRVNHLFEPVEKVGTYFVALGFLSPAVTVYRQTCSPLTRKGPRFQGVGSKNEC